MSLPELKKLLEMPETEWSQAVTSRPGITLSRDDLCSLLALVYLQHQALGARRQATLTRREYYRQSDLGQPPSEDWGKLDFVEVTRTKMDADDLEQIALAAFAEAGGEA